MRVHVLLNPDSAGGRARARWRRLEPLAHRLFADLTIHVGAAPGDLSLRAAAVAREDALVIAAGGDGTSHEVVNGLASAGATCQAAMGWLPLGSGNDLARGIGVPLDPRRALEGYREPSFGRIDLGMVRHRGEAGEPTARFFGNSFTVGLSAEVLRIVTRVGKPLGGPVSYFLATVAALTRHRPMGLTLDGEAGHYRLVSVTNGETFGAGMRVTPAARLDDGHLDLLTVAGISRLATARVLPSIYWAGHLRHPAVRVRPCHRLAIETAGPVWFEADGELGRGVGPFSIAVEPGALRVARPSGRRLNSTA